MVENLALAIRNLELGGQTRGTPTGAGALVLQKINSYGLETSRSQLPQIALKSPSRILLNNQMTSSGGG